MTALLVSDCVVSYLALLVYKPRLEGNPVSGKVKVVLAVSDLEVSDLTVSDFAVSDLTVSDLAVSYLGVSDLEVPVLW